MMFDHTGCSDSYIRRMLEPDDLRELRRQAERIRADRALAAKRFVNDVDRERLRAEIRRAGEKPCH